MSKPKSPTGPTGPTDPTVQSDAPSDELAKDQENDNANADGLRKEGQQDGEIEPLTAEELEEALNSIFVAVSALFETFDYPPGAMMDKRRVLEKGIPDLNALGTLLGREESPRRMG